eukprot:COSAG01_NODE_357_length_18296_cov_18.974615_6_plen_98_part_00
MHQLSRVRRAAGAEERGQRSLPVPDVWGSVARLGRAHPDAVGALHDPPGRAVGGLEGPAEAWGSSHGDPERLRQIVGAEPDGLHHAAELLLLLRCQR